MYALLFFVFFALIIFLVIFFIKFYKLVYPLLFWGGIYVPTSENRVKEMIRLLNISKGEKVVDLGAGDGRMVIEAANAGAEAHGYEISPALVRLAKKNICTAGMQNKAFVFQGNLWHQNLSNFDAVAVYGMGHMMKKLEKKFEKELKPGAKVVSNYFALPSWKPESKAGNIYFYIKK